ncbi:SMAD/FHA domain-containing protein [Dentipellis sp. KUC8613]|nr:SMAD/FHA domain-containing protein [Dentipellis sp. KUC8613]
MSTPFVRDPTKQPLPALYLYPLNDTFSPIHLHLPANQRVEIDRRTQRASGGHGHGHERVFDSLTMSKKHAEVWEDAGEIFVMDMGSSNGTFLNGERLSPEGEASKPFQIQTDDIVEFGQNMLRDANADPSSTAIHPCVCARVVCVLGDQDAQFAARLTELYDGLPPAPPEDLDVPSPSLPVRGSTALPDKDGARPRQAQAQAVE